MHSLFFFSFLILLYKEKATVKNIAYNFTLDLLLAEWVLGEAKKKHEKFKWLEIIIEYFWISFFCIQ